MQVKIQSIIFDTCRRQPKAPPIRNSCKFSIGNSKYLYHLQATGGQSTSASVYTVLHSRPPKHQLVQERAHSQGASGKYHYNHPKVQTRGGSKCQCMNKQL